MDGALDDLAMSSPSRLIASDASVTVVRALSPTELGAYIELTDAQKSRRRASMGVALAGNLIEWFNFFVYAYCAIYFAPAFFPAADTTGQLLNTAGVFGAGFVMRPLGGWLFGRLADRSGRRHALVLSVLCMCVGSLMLAFTPAYADIGQWAPLVLIMARLVQGLSVGGEYGTAATYLSEAAPPGRRGFYSSFQYVTLIGGQLAAASVIVALQQLLTEAELVAWGWRIPFIIGAASALIALVFRLRLGETFDTEARHQKGAGSIGAVWRTHRPAFLMVVGFTAGGSLVFYTFTTYMQKFLVISAGMSIQTSSAVMTACLFVFVCAQPVLGALSDRIGRRRNMLIFGIAGTGLLAPTLDALQNVANPIEAFFLISTALLIISFYTSVAGIVKAEMFPAEVRAIGVGSSYALANAVFGGSAEFVALSFGSSGINKLFEIYVVAMMIVALFVSLKLPRHGGYLKD